MDMVIYHWSSFRIVIVCHAFSLVFVIKNFTLMELGSTSIKKKKRNTINTFRVSSKSQNRDSKILRVMLGKMHILSHVSLVYGNPYFILFNTEPMPTGDWKREYIYLTKLDVEEPGSLGVTVPSPGMWTYPLYPIFKGGATILILKK